MATEVFNTPGTYHWVAPATMSVLVELKGGGAATFSSGGSGGGGYANKTVSVVKDTSYTLVVGPGNSAFGGGDSTWVNGGQFIIARGGWGYGVVDANFGLGGGAYSNALNSGTITHVGGNGVAGGGGGSCAGAAADGNPGSGSTGGAAVGGGGKGGDSGQSGDTIGGGSGNGGATGGDGWGQLTYTLPPPPPPPSAYGLRILRSQQ